MQIAWDMTYHTKSILITDNGILYEGRVYLCVEEGRGVLSILIGQKNKGSVGGLFEDKRPQQSKWPEMKKRRGRGEDRGSIAAHSSIPYEIINQILTQMQLLSMNSLALLPFL